MRLYNLILKLAQAYNGGLVSLNTSASSETTDGKLVSALTALGWLDEVIE